MKILAIFAAVLVAGCMETAPPTPHPALVALQKACNDGDTQSCAKVLEINQRDAAMRQAAAARYAATVQRNNQATMQANTDLFARTMQRPTQTQCAPGGYGMINCTSY